MQLNVETPEAYIEQLPHDRKKAISKLREAILSNIPDGFSEVISYGMIGYVVPHSKYPKGYHSNPRLPLPFMNIASQKNYVAFYHMGLYGNKDLLEWFTKEYADEFQTKLDMGKGCIRFKNMEKIPYKLIGELVSKINPDEWITIYEQNLRK